MVFTFSNIKGLYFTTPETSFSTIKQKIQDLGRNYISNGLSSIDSAIIQYQSSTDKHLFGVFCVSEADEKEEWICLNVTKKHCDHRSTVSAVVSTFREADASTYEVVENTLKCFFNEESYDLTVNQHSGPLNTVINNALEAYSTVPQQFDHAVVAQVCEVRVKDQLNRFLSSLESILVSAPKYKLDPEMFTDFCQKINSVNFGPSKDDVIDLRAKILALIVQLKENGQKIDTNIVKDEFETRYGFLVKESSIFLKEIKDYDGKLKEDPRNTTALKCLQFAINDRIKYLSNKNKLLPDLVKADEVLEIFEHFVLNEEIERLEKEEDRLKKECVEEFKKIGEATKEDDPLLQASIDENMKLQQIKHELEYLRVKFSIRNDCNFKNLIPVLASKAPEKLKVHPNFLRKIFKVEVSESQVTDIMKIISSLPKTDKIQNFPDELYQYLTCEQLIELVDRLSVFSSTFIDHLVTVIVENDEEPLRVRALDALIGTHDLSDEATAIINLERKIQSDAFNTIDLLTHVTKNYRLTRSSFQILKRFGNDELTVITTIIDNDLQTLPKFLVDAIKTKIKSNLVPSMFRFIQKVRHYFSNSDLINLTLKMCELMIVGNYMKLSDVADCLVNYLKDEKHQEIVLNIILTASQSGEIITGPIVKELQMIEPKTALVHNCIKAVTNEETLFDVLKNSKKSIEDRKSALDQLVNNKTYHNDYLVHILIDLGIFEPKLRDDAFEAFLTVITSDTWKNCCDRFSEMVEALKVPDSRVSIKAINDASKKDFLRHNGALIDYLLFRLSGDDFLIKTDCVSILTNMLKSSQNRVWAQMLLDIVYSERDTTIKRSALNLIIQGFVLESFDSSFQIEVETLKTLLCDKIDVTSLSSLVVMIEQGLLLPESIIQEIIPYLLNDEYSTMASECLWMIHLTQGLMPQSLQSVISTIEDLPTTLNNQHALDLLHRGINSSQKLSFRMLQRLLELLSDDGLKLHALNILDDYMIGVPHDSMLKHQFLEILKEHCLKIKDMKYIRQALRTLVLIDESIESNDGFISYFYGKLQPSLFISSDVSKKNLTKFISTKNKDRIQLLYALTIIITEGYHLNPEIFVKNSEDEWLKEVLIDILIQSIIFETGEMDELAFSDFLTEMKVLEVNLSKNDQRLEPVLKCLVDSNLNNFESISEVMFLIRDTDALKIFLSNSKDIEHKICKMKEILLGKRLSPFSQQQLQKLMKHVSHLPARMIESLIDIECDSPESLIKFFERVQSNLEKEQQKSFFNKISKFRSLQELNTELSRMIIDQLIKERQIFLNNTLTPLKQKLSNVLESGWSIHSIQMILDHYNDLQDAQSVLSAMNVIYEYNLKEYDTDVTGKSLIDIITTTPVTHWDQDFHKIAIFQTFPGTYRKTVEQLYEEILELNSGYDIGYLKDRKKMKGDYDEIMKAYRKNSMILTETLPISKYDEELIKKWSKQCKDRQPSVYELVAVTMQALRVIFSEDKKNFNFFPREIQILSLLCFLNPEENKGRLAQINTGEGKTTIIAMFAVIKALQGHKIDIITSSGELAKPQSIEMEPFYSMFDLTVAHNGDDSKDIKERYKANILYGAADAFQGDILRDEYSKQGTRNGRKCDLAIVDEVDSMLIDGKNHIVMLSSFMPAMNYLETILAAIYIQIGTVANLIVERDGKTFLVDRKNRINDDGSTIKDVEDDEIEITVSKKEFIERSTELHIRRILRDTEGLKAFSENEQKIPEDYTELSIPKHLYELVTGTQLKKWIDSAIYAMFKCELNKHYVLTEDGKVAPVDATNTGVIQQNMHWNNGLHQFLQIKHGAKVTPENLTTNFISNVSFFKRYGANLFGLTGTLGSDDSIKLLNKTYSVDSLIIPPFKQKQHHELTPIIVANEEDWYSNIIESTLQKLHQGRGVLIIARYINQVNFIHESLKSKYDPKKIKIYKTQRESDSVHAELKVGEVIIATNIAGRGTDIKPSLKMTENGGLHVCLTFLPDNARVEAQNVGRTSRTGNKGTSQFILLEKTNQSLDQLRLIRNEKETESLKKAETEIARVCTKDAVFHEFCNFLNNFKKDEIRPVEERFGIWLQMNAEKFETDSEDTLIKKFKETFEVEVMKDKASNQLIQNICFYVLKANKLIKSKKYEKAIVEYDEAIKINPDFADIAYYCRGFCYIAKYGGDWWTSQNKKKIELARDDFEKARAIIKNRLRELNIIQRASDGQNLSEQVKHKTIIYQIQLGTIEQAIGIDKNEATEELNNLKKTEEKVKKQLCDKNTNENQDQGNDTEKLNEELQNIQNRIQQITKDIGEDDGGVIGKALDNNREIRIEMKGLETFLPPDQKLESEQELNEFRGNGMCGHFNISEHKPIPWKDVFIMASIAFVQIAAGAYLTVYTSGAASSFGVSLIFEGIGDLFTAFNSFISKNNINWKNWTMMKGVSLTVSLAMCGLCAAWDASKPVQGAKEAVSAAERIKTAGKGLGEELVKGMSYNLEPGAIIKGLKATTVGFKTFQHGGKQLGYKTAFTTFTAAEMFLIEKLAKGAGYVVNTLIKHELDFVLFKTVERYLVNKLTPDIQVYLQQNTQVQRLLQMDVTNQNTTYQNQIRQETQNILSDKNDLGIHNIAKVCSTRIAVEKTKDGTTQTQGVTEELATDELKTLEEKIFQKLNKSIDKIEKDSQNTTQRIITSPASDQSQENTNSICQTISEDMAHNITNKITSDIVTPDTNEPVNLSMENITSFEKEMAQELKIGRKDPVTNHVKDRISNVYETRLNDPVFMKKAIKQVGVFIKEFMEGGEIGLIEADFLSEAINRKINVYDKNGKLYKVINGHLPGEPLEVQYHPGQDGRPGHWTLPDGVEPTINTGGNNCFLDCIAHQTGRDSNELRDVTANYMIDNAERLAIVMPEIEYIKRYRSEYLKYGGDASNRYHFTQAEIILIANKRKWKNFETAEGMESASNEYDNCTDNIVRTRVRGIYGPGTRTEKRYISTSKETRNNLKKKGLKKGYERGHLVALQFGGTNAEINLVPMPTEFNQARGAYYTMEKEIANDIRRGFWYESTYNIYYSNETANEPMRYEIVHKISKTRGGRPVKIRVDIMNPLTNFRKTAFYHVKPDGSRGSLIRNFPYQGPSSNQGG